MESKVFEMSFNQFGMCDKQSSQGGMADNNQQETNQGLKRKGTCVDGN